MAVIHTWSAFHANSGLRGLRSQLLASQVYPQPLNGSHPDFLRYSESSLEASLVEGNEKDRIVFVSSDSCSASVKNLPKWGELLSGLKPPKADFEVWWATLDGEKLIQQGAHWVEDSGLALKVLRVKNPILFRAVTGIGATPSTLIVDQKGGIQSVAPGVLDASGIKIVRAWVERRSRTRCESEGLRL